MKALLEQIEPQSIHAFSFAQSSFEFIWHYHPQWECTWIEQGYGKRFVGDSVENFGPNDLVLLSGHLPHTWQSASEVRQVAATVVQFDVKEIQDLPLQIGVGSLHLLLQAATFGIVCTPTQLALETLRALPHARPFQQFALLLLLLDELGSLPYRKLSQTPFLQNDIQQKHTRLNVLNQYIRLHYNQVIRLDKLAELVHLTIPALCTFYKKQSGITLTQFINQCRMEAAAQKLLRTDATVSQILIEVGYASQAHFNRQFIKHFGVNPSQYRQTMQQHVRS